MDYRGFKIVDTLESEIHRMIKIVTERMILTPISREELRIKIEKETDAEMKQAYSEMLAGCIKSRAVSLVYRMDDAA